MNSFKYFMPTKIFAGEGCIDKNKEELKKLGEKALIITGKGSAKRNGSLNDVESALDALNLKYVLFDEIQENPTVEMIINASDLGKKEKVDFVIGIGGGSPMDSAKAAAFMIANPKKEIDFLFEPGDFKAIPIVEIPTTAGTGSEATPYSVLTWEEKKIKTGITQRTFASIAFLDAKYMMDMPNRVTINTAVDALTHLIEAYLCTDANFLSDKLAEVGLSVFSECITDIKNKNFTYEIREKLLLASTIAGIVISQSQTSLPHALGYYLTFNKHIPHGRANAIFIPEYLKMFHDKTKINFMLDLIGFHSIEDLDLYFKEVLDPREVFTEKDVKDYTKEMMKVTSKIATFPQEISEHDIYQLVYNSLLK